MFGFQPVLPDRMAVLTDTEGLKNLDGELRKESQYTDKERAQLNGLAQNLETFLQYLTNELGEEEAARFLFNAFGLPEQEILEEATPVHIYLRDNLIASSEDLERSVYEVNIKLYEMVRGVEEIIITKAMLRLEQLHKDKEKCERSKENMETAESKEGTLDDDQLEWTVAHRQKQIGRAHV